MAKRKESNTGFRNGELFCYNCGDHFNLQLPQAVRLVADIMKAFSKDHKHCAKTWTPPVVDQSLPAVDKAKWWKTGMNGERGASSEFMWTVLFYYERKIIKGPHPSDPDDFRRCYLLLQTVPEWKEKLHLMKGVSEVWSKLVDHWDTLTAMLEKEMVTETNWPEMYDLMKKLGC